MYFITWPLPEKHLLLNSIGVTFPNFWYGITVLQLVMLLSSWLRNDQAAIGHADKGTHGEKV